MGQRPRRACARPWRIWPTSCSSSTRSARPPRATPSRPTTNSSASSKTPSTSTRPTTRSPPSPTSSATWNRPSPWIACSVGDVGYGKTEVAMRAAFKAVQDGKPGRRPHAHHRPQLPALRDLQEPLPPVPHQRRDDLPLPHAQRAEAHPRAGRKRPRRHPHRHPSPALEGHQVPRPRPARRRRGAALRRAPQRAPQADAPRNRRARHVRHAHPAHAAHVAGRPARHERHRDAAHATAWPSRPSSPSSTRS